MPWPLENVPTCRLKKVSRSRKWLILVPCGSPAPAETGCGCVGHILGFAASLRLDLNQGHACFRAPYTVIWITHPGALPPRSRLSPDWKRMAPVLTTYPPDSQTPQSAARDVLQSIVWLRRVPASTLHA